MATAFQSIVSICSPCGFKAFTLDCDNFNSFPSFEVKQRTRVAPAWTASTVKGFVGILREPLVIKVYNG